VVALLLTIMMVLTCFDRRPGPPLRREGFMALGLLSLALLLAVLGRWSSGTRVPAVAMGNLLGGVAMVALCARLSLAGRLDPTPGLRLWIAPALLLLLGQVALGGLTSASYASLSCSSWSDCLAAADQVAWGALDPWREPVLRQLSALGPAVNPDGALVQTLHRGMALLLAVSLSGLALAAWRRGRAKLALLLMLLLAAQIALGLALSQGSLPLSLALLHNLLAACLLAALILLV
jgi:cytochrome c oxidase assembly protein subunit 15